MNIPDCLKVELWQLKRLSGAKFHLLSPFPIFDSGQLDCADFHDISTQKVMCIHLAVHVARTLKEC